MRYLIDSSAWIEYMEGSEAGERVNKLLKNENEIYVIAINIAEVVSKIKRMQKNSELAYRSMISNSKIADISPKIAKEAGLLHAEKKSIMPGFSLADALIIKTAQAISAKIITTDRHFKNFKEAVLIR